MASLWWKVLLCVDWEWDVKIYTHNMAESAPENADFTVGHIQAIKLDAFVWLDQQLGAVILW